MTSEERRAERRARREAERIRKRVAKTSQNYTTATVFTYYHAVEAYRNCKKNVNWKPSVQRYAALHGLKLAKMLVRVRRGSFRSKGFYTFYLYERGKMRFIQAVRIEERVVQRILCDYCLVPLLSSTFIFDNGASLIDKGYHFTVKRLRQHLTKYIRDFGLEGYVLIFDFHDFFASINHERVKEIVRAYIIDPQLADLTCYFVDCFDGNVGLGLGSQVSQILGLAFVSMIDHYTKEVLGIKAYGRYNDDGYLIHPSKTYLQFCMMKIGELASSIGLCINWKKTHIIKLSHGFTFIKKRFIPTRTGRLIMKPSKLSIKAERKRLRKLKSRVERGLMTEEDVWQSFQSVRAYLKMGNSWKGIVGLSNYYAHLFGYSSFGEMRKLYERNLPVCQQNSIMVSGNLTTE